MKTYSKLSFVFVALSVVVSLAVSVSTVIPAAAANTIYYVDCTGGNDANNGTSTTTAWATVTRASQNTYGAGDQILLKRGCVWTNQTFTALGSGTVASRVTLADYGTGNLPKIDAFQNSAVFLQNTQN